MGASADKKKIGETPYEEIEKHIGNMGQKDIHANFEHWCREWAVEALFPNSDQTELVGKVIGASGEIGVDSYIIHQPSQKVVIIQSKWHYKDDKESGDLILNLKGCMNILGDSKVTSKISQNQERIRMDEEIEALATTLGDPKDISFEIYLISNHDLKQTAEGLRKTPILLGEYGEIEKITYWGPSEIERRYQIEAGLQIEPITNEDRKLEGHFLFSDTDEGLMIGYVKTVDMKVFFGVPGNTAKKDLRLLAPNIRMRKATGKSAKAEAKDPAERIAYRMRDTLQKQAAKFARRNNGLQIVVDDFEVTDKSWKSGTQYFNGEVKLVNPGVSNGGQTIQEIWDIEDTKLADSRVAVKIIKCETLTERTENAISSNSQNATVPRNFRANDDDMLALQKKFEGFNPKIFLDVKEKEWENRLTVEPMKTKFPAGFYDNEWVGKLIWSWYGGWGAVNSATGDMWHGELTGDLFDINKSELAYTYALPERLGRKPVKISAKGSEFVEVTMLAAFLENLWRNIKGHKTAKRDQYPKDSIDRENVLKKNLFCGSAWPAFIGLVNYTMKKRQSKPSELLEHLIGQKYTKRDYPHWIFKSTHKNYEDIIGEVNLDTAKHQIINKGHTPSEKKFNAAQKWAYTLYNCMFLASSKWQSAGNDLSAANLYHSSGHQDFIHKCTMEIDNIFDQDEEEECFPLPSTGASTASTSSTVSVVVGGGDGTELEKAKMRVDGWVKAIQKEQLKEPILKKRIIKAIESVLLIKEKDINFYVLLEEACEDFLHLDLDDFVTNNSVTLVNGVTGDEMESTVDTSDESPGNIVAGDEMKSTVDTSDEEDNDDEDDSSEEGKKTFEF